MEFLSDLWLPIVINTVALFFASFAAWTLLPHHFGDLKKLDDQDGFIETIRSKNIPAGNYMFPYASSKQEQTSEAYMEKYKQGPRGLLSVWEMPNMAMNMACTVLFFFVTTAIIAYVTHIACPPGAAETDFMKVFRVSGTIGVLVHGSSGVLNGIWFKRRLVTDIVDGIAYGIILGLIFAICYALLGLTGAAAAA